MVCDLATAQLMNTQYYYQEDSNVLVITNLVTDFGTTIMSEPITSKHFKQ